MRPPDTGRPLSIAFAGTRGVPAGEGGIERHVEELGARLADRGHQVTVYCRTNYVRERPESHRGMRLRYLPSAGTRSTDFLVHTALSTLDALRRPPDIIHLHALGSALVAPLARVSRSRVVLTVHGLDHERAKWGLVARTALKTGAYLSARVPHATITVSEALAQHYAARYGRSCTTIPNGVPEWSPRPPGRALSRLGLTPGRYVLFVGRLVPEKSPDVLLEAFRGLPGAGLRLVLAGSSGFTDDYVARLRALAGQDPRVVMPGGVYGEELQELFAHAGAFVLPSALEGLPITLLEAAASATPVVVSDIAPHLEVVGADAPGSRVFPVGDVEALRSRLGEVLSAPERERSGAAGLSRRVRAAYSWDAAADHTERLYRSLTGTGWLRAPEPTTA